MNFTAIIYQIGNTDNLNRTKENLIDLGVNVIYVQGEDVIAESKDAMRSVPIKAMRPTDLLLKDFILYVKSGAVIDEESLITILAAFDEIKEPQIGGVYTEYLLTTKSYTLPMYVPSYDRMTWLQTMMEVPILALRKTPQLQVTLTPDHPYFNYVNQSFPIVKIPKVLVTVYG